MKRTIHAPIRALALLLAVMLMLTAAPLTAFAQTSDEDQAATPAAENVTQATSTQADTTATAMPPATLTAADIPEMLSATALAQRGTVRRVYEEETDASTLLFENNDGTRTMYLFGAPVKYIAPDGTTRDKSTAIATLSNLQPLWSGTALTPAQTTALAQNASIGRLDLDAAADALTLMSNRLGAAYGNELTLSDIAYATLDSDIRTLYPAVVTDGIVLNYGDYSIRTIPITTGNLTLPGLASVAETGSLTDAETRTRVRYNSVFGTGTVLQYTPTNMGVKEEIILTRNVGKNEFPFLLETGGLNIVEQNGSYVFLDPTTQNVIATLGEVIVYDSNGAITRGEMTVQTIREGLQYGVTLTVSENFLANAAYPVSVDPTKKIYAGAPQTEVHIENVGVYSDSDAWNYTFDTIHAIGKVYDTNYAGQAVYRFPCMYNANLLENYVSLTSDKIISFTLHLEVLAGTDAGNSLYVNPFVPPWNAGTRICDSSYYNYYDMTLYNIPVTSVPTSGTLDVNLTAIAKEWLDQVHGTSNYYYGNPSSGIVIRNADSSKQCYVRASSPSTQATVTLDFIAPDDNGNFYLNNGYTRTFLSFSGNNTSVQGGLIADIGNSITWTIEYQGNDQYYFHPNGQTGKYLSWTGTITETPALWTAESSSGVIQYSTPTGELLGVDSSGNVVVQAYELYDDEMQTKWANVSTSEYQERSAFSYPDLWLYPGSIHLIPIPFEDANFEMPSNYQCESSDPDVAYLNGFTLIVQNDAWGYWTDITVTHLPTNRSATFTVHVWPLADGVYCIKTMKNELFAQINNGDASNDYSTGNEILEVHNYTGEEQQQWQFTSLSDGYYKITSVASSLALSVNPNETNSTSTLIQSAYTGAATQKWSITYSVHDGYIICPASASETDWCMSTATLAISGANVKQMVYVLDSSLNDEWDIIPYENSSNETENEFVDFEDFEDINDNLLYYIKSATKHDSLDLNGNNITEHRLLCLSDTTIVADDSQPEFVTPGTGDPPSNLLWRFESAGDGYYKILSMNTCYPAGTSQNILLAYFGDNATMTAYDGSTTISEDACLWKIRKNPETNAIVISPKSNEDRYLTYASSDFAYVEPYSDELSEWTIVEYVNNAYWTVSGGMPDYSSYEPAAGISIHVTLDESWDSSIVPVSCVSGAVEMWNDISDNINLVFHPERQPGKTYLFEFVLDAYPTDWANINNAIAQTIAYDAQGAEVGCNGTISWSKVEIHLYYTKFSDDSNEADHQAVLAHEIGHALKLDHLLGDTHYGIMKGERTDLHYTPYLTNYDKSALINKWKYLGE